jgi:hypothetical protein
VDDARKHSLSGGFTWQYSLLRALSSPSAPACSSFSTSSREGAGAEKGGAWCGDDVGKGGDGAGEGSHGLRDLSLIKDLRNMAEDRPGVCEGVWVCVCVCVRVGGWMGGCAWVVVSYSHTRTCNLHSKGGDMCKDASKCVSVSVSVSVYSAGGEILLNWLCRV